MLKNGYLILKGRLEDGTVVAVKVLSVESKPGETEFMSEVASMANINICHENLVTFMVVASMGPPEFLFMTTCKTAVSLKRFLVQYKFSLYLLY